VLSEGNRRKMSEAGISLDDMRAAFDEARDVEDVLGRLEETLDPLRPSHDPGFVESVLAALEP